MLRKKISKFRSPELIQTVHQKGCMLEDQLVREFGVQKNLSVLV
jgi:hypothetical protein